MRKGIISSSDEIPLGKPIEIRVAFPSDLSLYSEISIAFEVGSVLEISGDESRPADLSLVERKVSKRYHKDYDETGEGGPQSWPNRFDMSWWRLFLACRGGRAVGGAALVMRTPGMDLLEGEGDRAVLWDLRVTPEERGKGIGKVLFGSAVAQAREDGCREMIVETQDINVPACRFYAGRGCGLWRIRRGVYEAFPDEAQLLWRMVL